MIKIESFPFTLNFFVYKQFDLMDSTSKRQLKILGKQPCCIDYTLGVQPCVFF